MGLRIELEEIWKRLQTRFKARRKTDTDPEDPDHPVLIETVQPITNVDDLLKETNIYTGVTGTLGIARNDWDAIYTVPPGKRMMLRHIYALRATGDNTIDGIRFYDGTVSLIYQNFTAAAEYVSDPADVPRPLVENWEIQIHTSGAGVATSTFACRLLADMEDAY